MWSEKLKKVVAVFTMCLMLASSVCASAHSGRTDANGGHKDNKNKSGLGSYHYHCGGNPPHLHTNGVCPYKGGSSSSGASTSSSGTPSGSSKVSNVEKKIYASKVDVANMPNELDIGGSVKLKGTVYPSDAEDQQITWESSDSSIATIDSGGNLLAVGIGTVMISAKTSRGTVSKYTLSVNEIEAEDISIKGKCEEILIGGSVDLSVDFTPENTTDKEIKWMSDDVNVATVDENGVLTAIATGKTVISVVHKELKDSFEIEVKPILPESIEISFVSTSDEKKRFEVGETVDFFAVVLPDNTTDKNIKWSVDNTNVAEIDENGKLKAVSAGKVNVTAEAHNGIAESIEIEIYKDINFVGAFILVLLFGGTAAVIFAQLRKRKMKR